jgi:hypothetical protein
MKVIIRWDSMTVATRISTQPGTGYSIQRIIDGQRAWGNPVSRLTPRAQNTVFRITCARCRGRLSTNPMPKSGEPVMITIKATDPAGIASAVLKYQIVEPGQYINPRTRHTRRTGRRSMVDNAPAATNRAICTAVVRPAWIHRRLIVR